MIEGEKVRERRRISWKARKKQTQEKGIGQNWKEIKISTMSTFPKILNHISTDLHSSKRIPIQNTGYNVNDN